jgi:hypothetical protein
MEEKERKSERTKISHQKQKKICQNKLKKVKELKICQNKNLTKNFAGGYLNVQNFKPSSFYFMTNGDKMDGLGIICKKPDNKIQT